jgi:ribosomal RNA-processing protein 7
MRLISAGPRLFARLCDAPSHVLIASSLPLPEDDGALLSLLEACGVGARVVSRGASEAGVAWATVACDGARGASRLAAARLGRGGGAAASAPAPGAGLSAWLSAARADAAPSARELQAAADAEMAAFDAGAAAAADAKRVLAAQAAADGFTLVTRKTRVEGEDDIIVPRQKKRAGGGGAARADFYAFQKRSDKVAALETLRRAFEADRERIKRISASRTFRPL